MVVTTELLRKSTMEVPRKKEATVSEENTMTTHTACGKTARRKRVLQAINVRVFLKIVQFYT